MKPKEQRGKNLKNRPFMNRFDPVWLLLLFALIGFLFWQNTRRSQTDLVAGVYYQNRLIDVIDLTAPHPRQFSYPQNPAVVFTVTKDGAIAFASSDCPDQVCVHSGQLKRAGDYAACLPNGFVLRLGEKKAIGEPDRRLPEPDGREDGTRARIQLPTQAEAEQPPDLTVDIVQ